MKVFRLLTIVLLLASGLVAAVAAPAGAAVTPWRVASTFSRLGTEPDRVSCSSTGHCTAIEAGRLVTTSDGGTTWTDQTALVPPDALELTDVTCPVDTRCFLTGLAGSGTPVVYRVDSGVLTTVTPQGGTLPMPTIDCATDLTCATTDGVTFYSTPDAGATWTARALATPLSNTIPRSLTGLHVTADTGRGVAVSCVPLLTGCAVLGNTVSGTDAGSAVVEYTSNAGHT